MIGGCGAASPPLYHDGQFPLGTAPARPSRSCRSSRPLAISSVRLVSATDHPSGTQPGKKERKKKQKRKRKRKKTALPASRAAHCASPALPSHLDRHSGSPGLRSQVCVMQHLRGPVATLSPHAAALGWTRGLERCDRELAVGQVAHSPVHRSGFEAPDCRAGQQRPVGASGSSQPGPPSEPSKELEALPRAQSVPAAIRPIRRPRVVDLGLDSRANLPTT